jgi:hypothetical protein
MYDSSITGTGTVVQDFGAARPLDSQARYVVAGVRSTVVGGAEIITKDIDTSDLKPEPEPFVRQLARTPAWRRFPLLLKNDPIWAGAILASAIGALYVFSTAAILVLPSAISAFSISASASPQVHSDDMHPIIAGIISSRDPFDWMIVLVMAVILILSVLGSFLLENERKLAITGDTIKLIAGSFLGYLGGSGGKGRP